MARPRPIRLVHLSDLHLTASDEDSRSEPRLFGKLQGMNATFRALLREEPVQSADWILVTGDVTDRGDREAWEVFWAAVGEAGLKRRVRLVPGNHDVCHLGAPRIGERSRLMGEDLERMRAGVCLGRPRKQTLFPWVEFLEPGRLALIGLDSNNAGNGNGVVNAIGRIGNRQTRRLVRLLRQPEVAACPAKILLMHHSPNLPRARRGAEHYGPLSRWGHEVPDVDRVTLRHLCALGGVRLIAHGHLHRSDDRELDGVRIVGAPASTEPKPGTSGVYRVYGYEVRGATGRIHVTPIDLHPRP
ncbi:MAG: metallophosphoesterase [Deltaproteobacteria bacterium]|nr:metallophosphoesterase [Deltaproteobacteria bacterium]